MAGNLPTSGVSLIAQNAGQFISQMSSAQGALGAFGRAGGAMSNIVTGAFRQVGAIITNVVAHAVRDVGKWVGDSISVAGDFEETLNVMGATSGATAAQLEQVAAKAKELGADLDLPTTSANDAADVMLELSKAGLSVQESMDAAKGALLLAAAADTDAATATGILTGALNAFELPATDAIRIADLLAAGANASSASMTDLGQGLQQAGAIAHAAGIPVEDLITSLAALTNVGYTGSDAGTALKNALTRLINPTDKAAKLMAQLGFDAYDAQGKMKPLPVLLSDLNRSLAGMTDEQRNAALSTIFLSDGMKAMIPLLALGEDGFLALKGQVTEAGAATDVASARMKGWNGAVAGAKSQLETLQLTIGSVLRDALTPFVFKLGEFISHVSTLVDRFLKLAPAIGQSAAPVRTFLNILMILNPGLIGIVGVLFKLYDALSPVVALFTDGSVSGMDLASTLQTLLGPLGATKESTNAAAWAFQQIWAAIQKVGLILSGELPGATATAQGALATVVNFVLGTLIPALATATTWFAANLPAGIATTKAVLSDVGSFIGFLMPTIQSIVTTALAIITTFWRNHGTDVQTIVTGAYTAIKGVIQIVLGAIQGILAIVLGIMTGDWQTAMGTIQASNTTIWNGIEQFLRGTLNIIAAFFGTTLDQIIATWSTNWELAKTIASTVWGNIVSTVKTQVGQIASTVAIVIAGVVGTWNTLFGQIKSTVDSVMSGAASIVESKIGSIKGAFSSIVGVIDSAIGAVKRFIDICSKISVPDLVTPGSPTPLERGFEGIKRSVVDAGKALRAQFSPALGSAGVLPPTQSGPTTNTNTTYGPSYSMPIYTNQSPAVLSQGLALVQALGR